MQLGVYIRSDSFFQTTESAASAAVTAAFQQLLAVLEAQPASRLTLACSGFIWELLAGPCLERLRALNQHGLVEIFGSFFYEPHGSISNGADFAWHWSRTKRCLDEHQLALGPGTWVHQLANVPAALEAVPYEHASFLVVPQAFLEQPQSAASPITVDGRRYLFYRDTNPAVPASPLLYTIDVPCISTFDDAPAAALDTVIELLSRTRTEQLSLSSASTAESQTASLSFTEPPPDRSFPRIAERLEELRDTIEHLPDVITTQPHAFANRERLERVRDLYGRAQFRPLLSGDRLEQLKLAKFLYRSIISAQVEIDVITHPEVNPVEGWVGFDERRLADGQSLHVIDTAFLRAYLSPQSGEIESLEYKPRKCNLVPLAQNRGEHVFLRLSLEPGAEERLEPEQRNGLLQRTPDLLVYRAGAALRTPDIGGKAVHGFTAVQNISFRGGVGAHLSNATSGLGIEYWLERAEHTTGVLLLVLELAIALPSLQPEAVSARVLLPVGGVSDNALHPAGPLRLDAADVPGGLHGIRLIDGLEHFIVELRSAKPLSRIELRPLPDPGGETSSAAFGVLVRMLQPADRLVGDWRSNTLFVSIP